MEAAERQVESMLRNRPESFKVLVVEDQEGPREALTVILRPFGQVIAVTTALAAIEVLWQQDIDLVIEDVGLPDKNGIDLLKDIRALCPSIGVIVITGAGTVQSAEDAIEYGAIAYLLKPFSFQELIALVQDAKGQMRNGAR
jgi:putative two-component system response regulator